MDHLVSSTPQIETQLKTTNLLKKQNPSSSMISQIRQSEQLKMAEASAFYLVCQEQLRKYWSIKGVKIDPNFDKLISSALSTQQLINAIRTFEPISANILMLLNKAEIKLDRIKHIKSSARPQIYHVTTQLRYVFVQIAADLLKLLDAADKEWLVVVEEEIEEEDFVMV